MVHLVIQGGKHATPCIERDSTRGQIPSLPTPVGVPTEIPGLASARWTDPSDRSSAIRRLRHEAQAGIRSGVNSTIWIWDLYMISVVEIQ
jgi:hypothetical protein